MRLFGHPVHVMLIHFPVALWPAHWVLQICAHLLPAGVAAVAGFWLLVAATGFGWLAAVAGAADLLVLWKQNDTVRVNLALIHAAINGSVLGGFTLLTALEYRVYPHISHGAGFLSVEAALIVLLLAGNYFGGMIVWGDAK